MYKVVVNVSGKRARIVPESHRLLTAERDFGHLTQSEALMNIDGLEDAVRGLLTEKDIQDPELYTVEVPDNLRPDNESEKRAIELEAAQEKGPVTKPENPKEGEQNSETNRPEQKPTETPVKPKTEQTPVKPGENVEKDEKEGKTS
jgi:hypothetical protein